MLNWKTKRKIKHLLPPVLFLVVFVVMAVNNIVRADTVTVHLASKHITASGEDYGFRESNLGLGYGYTVNDNLRVTAGGYQNSEDMESFYLAAEVYKRFDNTAITEIGGDVGVISGYNLDVPVGAMAYARLADVLKVSAMPLVINHPVNGVFIDGVVLGFSLTWGQ